MRSLLVLLPVLMAAAAQAQTADALRRDVTYLASPELGGRGTPSPGLDLAAKFLVEKFQVAALKPAANGGYLQGDSTDKGPWNVAGILRGSDATLREEFVIISAHYDHLGFQKGEMYPGANDDASGASLLAELASAITHGKRPKRSILFIAFFGEELGLKGSLYYVQHPLVPLQKTIAAITMEQMGRTDDSEGRETAAFAMTGTSYTDLPEIVEPALKKTGVSLFHRKAEDLYFRYSDNYPFAMKGIPDTAFAVSFQFPDYHKPGDTAEKLDYDNFAKVGAGVRVALLKITNQREKPVWKKKPPDASVPEPDSQPQ